MPDYSWKPIAPLSNEERRLDLGAIAPLYESWRSARKRIQESSQAKLAEFNRRLIRRLSVETGILEHLYDLDRGTTEALVAQGFAEELVTRSSTNIEPSRLIDLLRDQEAAIQLVLDCVANNRALSKGLIHELHAMLTRNQETTVAVDQFGNRLEIPLLKGKYKDKPNNPRRPDGSMHEYCPPVQVDSEMENLVNWAAAYAAEDPVIVASWLHHRFTQIHPYQDGNGRVARALTTMILLRADLLPLVVDRDLRVEYISALETADRGSLAPLAKLFARLERAAILQALSVDTESEIAHQKSLTSAVIGSLADKFARRRTQKLAELRGVNAVAVKLRGRAEASIEASLGRVRDGVPELAAAKVVTHSGGSDFGNAHWYRYEVTQSAKHAGTFANFAEDHYFVKGSIRVETERLVIVVSFHHVGRELSGIMEATAFAKLETFEDSGDRESVADDFFVCSLEPLVFAHQTNPEDVADTFDHWLDAALAVALKEFGDRL